MTIESGQTLSHYRLVEKIGEGGMGVVWKAQDQVLGRTVAIKVLPADVAGDETRRKMFLDEARLASSVSDAHIAQVHELGRQGDLDFIVMEYVEGKALNRILHGRPLPPEKVAELGHQVARALSRAHRKGLLHRDLKPSNILVTPDGEAKVVDFGLATLFERRDATLTSMATTETAAAHDGAGHPDTSHKHAGLAGTLPYMSPEQVRSETLDARSDIFSLGVVLYEMTTRQRPFSGPTNVALLKEIVRARPRPPHELSPKVPLDLERIIQKALAPAKADRYQTMDDLAVDLKRLGRDLESGSSPSFDEVGQALRPRRRYWPWVVSAAAGVALLAAGLYLSSYRRPAVLTEKDTIVLAEIDNTTGEAIFDGTLRRGLSAQLIQSPFLHILSDEQVNDTLRLMGLPPGDRLVLDLAREVCQRTGGRAVLAGSIAPLGTRYVLDLRAVTCDTAAVLAQEQVQAKSKEEVLTALGQVATGIRARLGESLSSIQQFDVPLERVTTPSLEALRAYSLGEKAANENDDLSAVPFFKRALELDPNFVMAYMTLGGCYGNRGEADLATQYYTKAYELRDRVSQRERFIISAGYYGYGVGDIARAAQVYEGWSRFSPRESIPLNNLAEMLATQGKYESAVEYLTRDLQLVQSTIPYANLMFAELALGHLDTALALYDQATARQLNLVRLHRFRYWIAFLQGDQVEMTRQITLAPGSGNDENSLQSCQADTESYKGHFANARVLSRQTIESALQNKNTEIAATRHLAAAIREVEFGHPDLARANVDSGLSLISTQNVQILAAVVLARAGEPAKAEALADDLANRFPLNTMLNVYWLPVIRAAIALARNDPSKAVERLKPAAAYDFALPTPAPSLGAYIYPVYLRGQAFLLLGNGDDAAAQFEKFRERRALAANSPLAPLAPLGLARAYTLSGDRTKARAAYEEFLTQWKDADPDIPALLQAKAEYAKLN